MHTGWPKLYRRLLRVTFAVLGTALLSAPGLVSAQTERAPYAQAPPTQAPSSQAPSNQTQTTQAPPAQRQTAQTPSAQTPSAQTQSAQTQSAQTQSAQTPRLTLFPHSETRPWWLSGQANIIFQAHPGFHSPYSGPNSLQGGGEYKTSLLGTLYTGYAWHQNSRFETDFLVDIEASGGRGISQALGLAGFTNLDVVRNPNLGSRPYLARGEIVQILGLSAKRVSQSRDSLDLATKVPARRLELRVGKMSLPDQFDTNEVGSDSHLQFMNWTIDNNGAWDYAADTRGYTVGGILEYDAPSWEFRYGIFAMPTTANGEALDWAFSRANGQNWEFDWNHSLVRGRHGVMRLLGYMNHAHMGDYRQSVNLYLAGKTPTPEITATERFGQVKYGFGWNEEQDATDHLRLFSRFGWNPDKYESYAYTEVAQTVSAGGDYDGAQWHRPYDKIGLAFASNAIKRDHQRYLALGGLGFMLGDGHLRYGRENIVESYYNLHVRRGLYFAVDLQHVDNPGYNRDRGPVWVESVRSHIDF